MANAVPMHQPQAVGEIESRVRRDDVAHHEVRDGGGICHSARQHDAACAIALREDAYQSVTFKYDHEADVLVGHDPYGVVDRVAWSDAKDGLRKIAQNLLQGT